MKIILDTEASFQGLEKSVTTLVGQGFKTILVFHAEGGIDKIPGFKGRCDTLLAKASGQGIRIFGGIFPAIIDNGRLVTRGSIIAGIRARTHVVTLDRLGRPDLMDHIDDQLAPVAPLLRAGRFKTLFVIGDGFGESNLSLIQGLNHITRQFPMTVIGGLAGRNGVKASLYNIFTPEKVIQNGAVLAFTDLATGIGVNHGWTPLPKSQCTITRTNDCYVETINHQPALSFYLNFIARIDPEIHRQKTRLMAGESDLFFKEVAIKYPLGLVREVENQTLLIDRTAVSVGADKSLQFSAEIPKGTQACILHLTGKSATAQCLNIKEAAQSAYIESLRQFPVSIPDPRVIIMDCFGRKEMVDYLGQDYEQTEFDMIRMDQSEKDHSPIGVLTFGEISSLPDLGVELHNKTAVVATIEDN